MRAFASRILPFNQPGFSLRLSLASLSALRQKQKDEKPTDQLGRASFDNFVKIEKEPAKLFYLLVAYLCIFAENVLV